MSDVANTNNVVPVLDEHDTAAVKTLLLHAARIQDADDIDRKLIEKLQADIDGRVSQRGKVYAALSVFGFEQDNSLWPSVQSAIGSEVYNKMLYLARRDVSIERKKLLGDSISFTVKYNDHELSQELSSSPNLSSIILEYLSSMDEHGASLGQIRSYLKNVYPVELHEKTPSMTLSRLLRAGDVIRNGRNWVSATRSSGRQLSDNLKQITATDQ